MSDFRINGDMFGMYVRIPTDFSGALHIYKVVGLIESKATAMFLSNASQSRFYMITLFLSCWSSIAGFARRKLCA